MARFWLHRPKFEPMHSSHRRAHSSRYSRVAANDAHERHQSGKHENASVTATDALETPDETLEVAPALRHGVDLHLEHTPVAPTIVPPPRRDTPLRPVAMPPMQDARATLTLLTGQRSGHVHSIDGAATTIGRSAESDFVVDEEGVSRHHARIDRTADGAFYIEDVGSTNGTFLGAHRVGVALLRGGDLVQLGPLVQMRFAIVDSPEESFYRRLYESSMHDPLTHVFNRAYMNDRLLAEVSSARRAGTDMTVLMLDVDNLKEVNDRFGHMAGDRALCTIASRIVRTLRATDTLARYGGDEFVVIATATGGEEAWLLAERVRRAVAGLHMSARGGTVHITASIGVASLSEVALREDPASELLALADERMYDAKAAGRNRVCISSVPPAK